MHDLHDGTTKLINQQQKAPFPDRAKVRDKVGLAYVSAFSMLLGFVFWHRGLALGGIAAVGQLQLLQPALGLAASALVLHETVPPVIIATTAAIILCVARAKRFV